MTDSDIAQAVGEFAQSARLAIEAGFDGVEVHAANADLIEQFLNASVNHRQDAYGAGISGRNRFARKVVRAVAEAIGADRVGIRLSPFGVFNGPGAYPEVAAQYLALVDELSTLGLLYVHWLDHSAMGAPAVPAELKSAVRNHFSGSFILAGGFDRDSAEQALSQGQADLIGFGRPFLANPYLIERLRAEGAPNSALSAPDMETFCTPGPKGYTDYPMPTPTP